MERKEAINNLLKLLDATENCVVVYEPKDGQPVLLADTRKKKMRRENNATRFTK